MSQDDSSSFRRLLLLTSATVVAHSAEPEIWRYVLGEILDGLPPDENDDPDRCLRTELRVVLCGDANEIVAETRNTRYWRSLLASLEVESLDTQLLTLLRTGDSITARSVSPVVWRDLLDELCRGAASGDDDPDRNLRTELLITLAVGAGEVVAEASDPRLWRATLARLEADPP